MTTRPRRIQRQRAKGWRMPEGAKYVGRPTIFGNPFAVGDRVSRRRRGVIEQITVRDKAHAVALYRQWVDDPHNAYIEDVHQPHPNLVAHELRGLDLACWCGPDDPCHVDVLLPLANPETP